MCDYMVELKMVAFKIGCGRIVRVKKQKLMSLFLMYVVVTEQMGAVYFYEKSFWSLLYNYKDVTNVLLQDMKLQIHAVVVLLTDVRMCVKEVQFLLTITTWHTLINQSVLNADSVQKFVLSLLL